MLAGELHFLSMRRLLQSDAMRKLDLLAPVTSERLLTADRNDEWPFLLVGLEGSTSYWMKPTTRRKPFGLDLPGECWVPGRAPRMLNFISNVDLMVCSTEVAMDCKRTKGPAALVTLADSQNPRICSLRFQAERLMAEYRCRLDALTWAPGQRMDAIVGRPRIAGAQRGAWVAAFLPVALEDGNLDDYQDGQRIRVELTATPTWADDPPNATLTVPARIVDEPASWDAHALRDFLFRNAFDHPGAALVPGEPQTGDARRLWEARTSPMFRKGERPDDFPAEAETPTLPGELVAEWA